MVTRLVFRASFAALLVTFLVTTTSAADCNLNGVEDDADIRIGTSSDCDGNLVPDECELLTTQPAFLPGAEVPGPDTGLVFDADGDGRSDLIALRDGTLLTYLSRGDGTFRDGDGDTDIAALHPAFRKAILFHENTGGDEFVTHSLSLPRELEQVDRISSALGGDLDRDGDVDLVVSHESSC